MISSKAINEINIEPQIKEKVLPILILMFLHIILGVVVSEYSIISTVLAIAPLVIGIIFLVIDHTPTRVLSVAAYMSGAEVLWRMTDAGVFHEYVKYAVSLLLLLAIIKWNRKLTFLPVFYFLLLLPSIIIVIGALDLNQARQEISANLSGPLGLAMAVIFFTRYKMNMEQLKSILLWIILPVISTATVALSSILNAESIIFTTSSNYFTTGGFPPNQVSAILGLGAMCCWIFVLIYKRTLLKLVYGLLFLWFLAQAILTFSRGGVLNTAIAIIPITLVYYRNTFRRLTTVILVIILTASVLFFILPRINIYTQGALLARYTERELGNRELLIQGDIDAFKEHPIVGVGPGMAGIYYYRYVGMNSASHTEFTRLLSEHGLLGVFSLLMLILILILSFFYNLSWGSKVFVLTFALWSLVEMTHAAMRIEAISLLIGLSTCLFGTKDSSIHL